MLQSLRDPGRLVSQKRPRVEFNPGVEIDSGDF
jgi:hypothetical protein